MPLKLHIKPIFLLISLVCIISCNNDVAVKFPKVSKEIKLKYASGFSANYYDGYKIISIKTPWPNAEKEYSYCIIDDKAKIDFNLNTFDAVIDTNIEKLVVTSTTHIPALELLSVENALVGFPGTDYISSEKVRMRIDNGEIRELGKNEGINTEVLLEIDPDIVIGFGVAGVNKTFETIKKAGIPVIYNGDWVESSALAKAEWIKLFGVLFKKEREADSIFNQIEKRYNEAKILATQAGDLPSVLSGAMHKDVWYLPNGSSPEGQFLKDANVNYLWGDTVGDGSLALSFEAVFEQAKDADIWLSPSYFSSFAQLEEANSLYTKFKAFQTKRVYTFSNTTGATGGVLYYELGTARPDLVLQDLIKICHPNLLPDYEPYFFKQLD
ncbi:ABC transporter substrate-binding protein [Winogradskyella alexanderae]|uniref:ABC transporter substrate-binding protein n=1 Tax=Winogradskyella alexanderae TaxID=2877123 RepID=A0ABS7XTK4_9FLAO|nr:ABC transporter substrate-binding protein [Winogradskyella alexanderae]MCA0132232.1 ABC transporter substrate-binding protein [Winogradskyella alexanderae]